MKKSKEKLCVNGIIVLWASSVGIKELQVRNYEIQTKMVQSYAQNGIRGSNLVYNLEQEEEEGDEECERGYNLEEYIEET